MKSIFSALFLSLTLSVIGNQIDTWSSPPDTISSTGIDSSNPHLAMDASGNIVAIWLEGDVVVSKTKLLNQSWSSADTLSGIGASSPRIVVDTSGNATAIWIEGGAVNTADKPFGMTWSGATLLAASGNSSPQ